jgi:tetratricopeptide (TPR) repeat protein
VNSDYTNPYVSSATQSVVTYVPTASDGGNEGQAETIYDYSKPIDTSTAPAEADTAQSAYTIFDSAREQFKIGKYNRALFLVNQALVDLPNDPVLHEFRAVTLFALKRYVEAAAVEYAALSAGPGWDWATLVGLYNSEDDYTRQFRALETYVEERPNAAPAQFLLGYHYLVQGHQEEAAAHFAKAAELRPGDTLSATLAEGLAKPPSSPVIPPAPTAVAAAAPTPPQTLRSGQLEASEPVKQPSSSLPADLAGVWMAQPNDQMAVTLTLTSDGTFSWAVSTDGQTHTIQGRASYKDDVLVLDQDDGPPLSGKIEVEASKTAFTFKPPGAPKDVAGLPFTRQPS